MTLEEFKETLKPDDIVEYELISYGKYTGIMKVWRVTENHIKRYFSKLSKEEYIHHRFKLIKE